MKNKHRIKQGLSLLLAGGIALTNLGAVMPAFAEDAASAKMAAEELRRENAALRKKVDDLHRRSLTSEA